VVPILIEAFIDLYLKITSDVSIADYLLERFIFVLVLGLPSIMFLQFRSTVFAVAIYVAMMTAANIAVAATIHNAGSSLVLIDLFKVTALYSIAVSRELQVKSKRFLPYCFSISILVSIINSVGVVYGVLYALDDSIRHIFELVEWISLLAQTLCFLYWLKVDFNVAY